MLRPCHRLCQCPAPIPQALPGGHLQVVSLLAGPSLPASPCPRGSLATRTRLPCAQGYWKCWRVDGAWCPCPVRVGIGGKSPTSSPCRWDGVPCSLSEGSSRVVPLSPAVTCSSVCPLLISLPSCLLTGDFWGHLPNKLSAPKSLSQGVPLGEFKL